MATVLYNENPKITDTIKFVLETRDSDGDLIDPYLVNRVSIYKIERSFFQDKLKEYVHEYDEGDYKEFYTEAVPVVNFGTDDFPAWSSIDIDNAILTKVTYDDNGDPIDGTFNLEWVPTTREGDYFVCWVWTLIGDDTFSNFVQFFVNGDTKSTTSIPTHFTTSGKYEKLSQRYMPELVEMSLRSDDVTPDVIAKYNNAIAKQFTHTENLGNQIIDLLDANSTPETILPYLAKLFGLKLKTQDTTLWRKQIKQAVSLYKKKGTLSALTDALISAGVTLNSLTMMWQVVSPYTWQEGFLISEDAQTEFILEKLVLLPTETDNFELYLRLDGDDTYTQLDVDDYVTFTNASGITTMTWIGDVAYVPIILGIGDFIKVIYKVVEPDVQSVENYIRTLDLADQRDELDITYPPKNWNVRLIQEDDTMFDVIISTKHPFVEPLVFGQIRTEFPYSENIYNMDEYNGSKRDSTDACDLDKDFMDACTSCRSSSFIVNVEIEDLSDDRIAEVNDIIREYKPFTTVVQSINYTGAVEEIIVPPYEEVEFLVKYTPNDNIIDGQFLFNRTMPLDTALEGQSLAFERDELASIANVVTPVSGTGKNNSIVLFSPTIRFDRLGVDVNNNLLEILSGTSQGEYTCSLNGNNVIIINQGEPDNITYPLDTSRNAYRLSNIIWEDASASIYQDNLFVFADVNLSFGKYAVQTSENSGSPWEIVISNGSNPGTYTVKDILPDDTLLLNGWPGTNQTSLSYQLQTNSSVLVDSGTTGTITVQNRGRVDTGDLTNVGVVQGNYLLYDGNQYLIIYFKDSDEFYIEDYTDGNVVGVASVKILKRLVNNDIGYLDVQGMYITSGVDYETSLGIVNGNNESIDGQPDTDSKFKENYLVKISGVYYKINTWDGTTINIEGPKLDWGLTGTSITYSIDRLTKTSPITVDGVTFNKIDRSNVHEVIIDTETVSSLMALDKPKNAFEDEIIAEEEVEFIIERF